MGWKKSKETISVEKEIKTLKEDFSIFTRVTNSSIKELREQVKYLSSDDYLLLNYDKTMKLLKEKDDIVLILDRIRKGICFEIGRNKVYQIERGNRQEYIEIEPSGKVNIHIYYNSPKRKTKYYDFDLGDYKTIFGNTTHKAYLHRIERLLFTE